MFLQSPFYLLLLPVLWCIVFLIHLFRRTEKRRTVPSILLWNDLSGRSLERSVYPRFLRIFRANRHLFVRLCILTLLVLSLTGPVWRCGSKSSEPAVHFIIDNECFTLAGIEEPLLRRIFEVLPPAGDMGLFTSSPEMRSAGTVALTDFPSFLRKIRDVSPSERRCSPDTLLAFLRDVMNSGAASQCFLLSGDHILTPFLAACCRPILSLESPYPYPAVISSLEWKDTREETLRVVITGAPAVAEIDTGRDIAAVVVARGERGKGVTRDVTIGSGSDRLLLPVPPDMGNILTVQLFGRKGDLLPDDADEVEKISHRAFICRDRDGDRRIRLALPAAGAPLMKRYFDLSTKPYQVIDTDITDAKAMEEVDILVSIGLKEPFDLQKSMANVKKGFCFFSPQVGCYPLFSVVSDTSGSSTRHVYPVGDHPVLRNIPLKDVKISPASHLLPGPSPHDILLQSNNGPCLAAGSYAGRRFMLCSAPLESLFHAFGGRFPVLMENIMEYLVNDHTCGIPSRVARGDPISSDFLADSEIVLAAPAEGVLNVSKKRTYFIPYRNGIYRISSGGEAITVTVNEPYPCTWKRNLTLWRIGSEPADGTDPPNNVTVAGDRESSHRLSSRSHWSRSLSSRHFSSRRPSSRRSSVPALPPSRAKSGTGSRDLALARYFASGALILCVCYWYIPGRRMSTRRKETRRAR
jgi:hypothetical protein